MSNAEPDLASPSLTNPETKAQGRGPLRRPPPGDPCAPSPTFGR
jgi:hypothetical protein